MASRSAAGSAATSGRGPFRWWWCRRGPGARTLPANSDKGGKERGGGSGLGLGLYITREIANAHGGTIHVESTETAGTHFIVELPRAQA
jgi:signal transduction histidine kinase